MSFLLKHLVPLLIVLATLIVVGGWGWYRWRTRKGGQLQKVSLEKLAHLVTVVGFPAVLIGGLAAYIQIAPAINDLWLRSSTPTLRSNTVFLIGSGTVREYLKRIFTANSDKKQLPDEDILERTITKEAQAETYALDGSTGTGVRLLTDAWDKALILAMASDHQTVAQLAPYRDKPAGLFEIFVGTDPLEVLLIAKNAKEFDEAFAKLLKAEKKEVLPISALAQLVLTQKVSGQNPFQVFVTERPSATRFLYRCYFQKTNQVDASWDWPSSGGPPVWEPGKEHWGTVVREHAAIVLGSQELNRRERDQLSRESNEGHPGQDKLTYRTLRVSMSSDGGTWLKRDLFLYGAFRRSDGSPAKLLMDPEVANVVKAILSHVRDGGSITGEERDRQLEYFHLRDGDRPSGWVTKELDFGSLYHPRIIASSGNLCEAT